MLTRYAFIFVGMPKDPKQARTVIGLDAFEATIVAVPEQAAAIRIAAALADAGVELIELCGTFGAVWTARVIEAIGGCVPVGSVAYGVEAIAPMNAIVVQPA